MSNKKTKPKDMVARNKNQALSCSTPEHRSISPSRDSDSVYDSDAASPVPFLCTQDGSGENEVGWNYYTPKSGATKAHSKNTTPVTRRVKRAEKYKVIDKPLTRKAVKPSQKKIKIFQELIELNELVNKPKLVTEKPQSEEDIFSDASDSSPRSAVKNQNRCLRKNVLSSKFIKNDPEYGFDSDDSMNESLIKASQAIENDPTAVNRPCIESSHKKYFKSDQNVNIGQDSMGKIYNNIKLESPKIKSLKKLETPQVNNDSFDNFLANIDDSTFEKLSQMPVQNKSMRLESNNKETNWAITDLIGDGSPSSKAVFSRHNSMPESPLMNENKPSTSGMVFGRHNSMPLNKSNDKIIVPGNSPIRCTPEEIKKKHQQARERLLAKRVLPFTATNQLNPSQSLQPPKQKQPTQPLQNKFQPKKALFQLKVPVQKMDQKTKTEAPKADINNDIKLLIEKKRQEALMKLRKRKNKF